MLKIYGSMLCKDCVQCREDLDKAGVSYIYLDFSRDTLEIFATAKENGSIGIPCIVDDSGNVTLSWEQYL